jgi:hypothetical protein
MRILADISSELGMEVNDCPFCGDAIGERDRWATLTASDNEWGIGWQVVCSFCGGRGPVAQGEKSAVFAWNRRQP